MNFNYYIGCDVSKNELDFVVMKGKEYLFHKEIPNTPSAIQAFVKELKKLGEFGLEKAVFCMEHTGIYINHLLVYLHKKKGNICLESASQIKNSLGNIRGKNDKVDAKRIAEYAYKNREELRMWQPKRDVIQKLAHLATTRSRLLVVQKQLKTPLKEANQFVSKSIAKQTENICQRTLKSIEADLMKVESAIAEIIKSDEELSRLFGIITSVKGVGEVTATQIIITTNEFKNIKDPKKFACYSGVAPFVKESGLMKGKGRVSHLANKKMKCILHLAAMSAVIHNDDMKAYYNRKVNEEKKNKMSVLNAVRNKLILNIFACVNQNRKYEKNYMKNVV
jgi:transposase